MGFTVKDNTLVAVEIEDTENTYKAPTSGSSFVQTLSDGTDITPTKEAIDRDVFNGSIGKTKSRTGMRSVSGSLPVELKSGDTEGAQPESHPLLMSALGGNRSSTAITTGILHTSSVINIDDVNIGDVVVGDMVLVKEAGAFHVSPVSQVDDTLGSANITLLVPMASAPSDNVEIAAFQTYHTANSGQASLSISKYVENAVLEQATGCKVTSMSVDNFSTGQIASINYGFEGMNFGRSLTAPPFAADFDGSLPPIILEACLYQDGVQVPVNSFSLSLENTLGFITATCSSNGRISGRTTERNISGSIDPYKADDNIDTFEKFDTNCDFSLFISAHVPKVVNCAVVPGEFEQVVGFYLPQVSITELGEEDQDGVLKETVSFQAHRGPKGDQEELYITVI